MPLQLNRSQAALTPAATQLYFLEALCPTTTLWISHPAATSWHLYFDLWTLDTVSPDCSGFCCWWYFMNLFHHSINLWIIIKNMDHIFCFVLFCFDLEELLISPHDVQQTVSPLWGAMKIYKPCVYYWWGLLLTEENLLMKIVLLWQAQNQADKLL